MKIEIKPTLEIARKVVQTVDAGLCSGLGSQVPGQMCVEAAVCYAFGLPHGDEPPCVGSAVRSFKITLNDCSWSSDFARAEGMRKLAIAQLGSNEISQVEFAKLLALKTCQKILPKTFRVIAEMEGLKKHKDKLMKCANDCEQASSSAAASDAAYDAYAASDAAYDAYAASDAAYDAYAASAAAYAARAANDAASAANAAASAASDAAYDAYDAYAANAAAYAASAANDTANAASAAASAASDAAYDAYAASDAAYDAYAASDECLKSMANIGLECLIEMKSPGCEWLFLCDEPATA